MWVYFLILLINYFIFANFLTKYMSEGTNEIIIVPIIILIPQIIYELMSLNNKNNINTIFINEKQSYFNSLLFKEKVKVLAQYSYKNAAIFGVSYTKDWFILIRFFIIGLMYGLTTESLKLLRRRGYIKKRDNDRNLIFTLGSIFIQVLILERIYVIKSIRNARRILKNIS